MGYADEDTRQHPSGMQGRTAVGMHLTVAPARGRAPRCQSVGDRARRHAGRLHGDPEHHHRQRRTSAYRGDHVTATTAREAG